MWVMMVMWVMMMMVVIIVHACIHMYIHTLPHPSPPHPLLLLPNNNNRTHSEETAAHSWSPVSAQQTST